MATTEIRKLERHGGILQMLSHVRSLLVVLEDFTLAGKEVNVPNLGVALGTIHDLVDRAVVELDGG